MLIIKTERFEKFMSRFAGVDMTDKIMKQFNYLFSI